MIKITELRLSKPQALGFQLDGTMELKTKGWNLETLLKHRAAHLGSINQYTSYVVYTITK